jgi:TonB family protein
LALQWTRADRCIEMLTGDIAVSSPDGMTIGGEILGLSNSFAIEAATPWVRKNRVPLLFTGSCLFSVVAFVVGISLKLYVENKSLDDLQIAVDLGDLIVPPKKQAAPTIEIDEVFGNEYVKDKKVVVSEDQEDPRAASAANPYIGGATMPVDLTPDIAPAYTPEAKAAGVQGTVTLEIVVSDDGRVLRARSVGKRLGHGLEEAAAAAFRQKRFTPSMKDGQPITVKFYQPVRFVLN